jgi:hypothetical protein
MVNGSYPQIMNVLQESTISCPYCGETISILVDGSVEEQQYIEDCEVCCRPMDIRVKVPENGSLRIDVRGEND